MRDAQQRADRRRAMLFATVGSTVLGAAFPRLQRWSAWLGHDRPRAIAAHLAVDTASIFAVRSLAAHLRRASAP
jgi:hypothetical protein